jgi:gas vesicle protein
MSDSSKTLLAFLGGAAVGAVVGLLLAPDKGTETRKKLLSRARDVGEDLGGALKDRYRSLMDGKGQIVDDLKDNAIGLVRDGANQNDQIARKLEKKIKNIDV